MVNSVLVWTMLLLLVVSPSHAWQISTPRTTTTSPFHHPVRRRHSMAVLSMTQTERSSSSLLQRFQSSVQGAIRFGVAQRALPNGTLVPRPPQVQKPPAYLLQPLTWVDRSIHQRDYGGEVPTSAARQRRPAPPPQEQLEQEQDQDEQQLVEEEPERPEQEEEEEPEQDSADAGTWDIFPTYKTTRATRMEPTPTVTANDDRIDAITPTTPVLEVEMATTTTTTDPSIVVNDDTTRTTTVSSRATTDVPPPQNHNNKDQTRSEMEDDSPDHKMNDDDDDGMVEATQKKDDATSSRELVGAGTAVNDPTTVPFFLQQTR